MKRRDFLKTSGTIATSSLLYSIPSLATAEKRVGLQLYTVRKDIRENLEGTLEQVAKIGYNSVELAGYSNGAFYKMKPAEFKKLANSFGLKVMSSHNGFSLEKVEQIANDNAELGVEFSVLPALGGKLRQTLDDYKKQAELFNKYGEACKKAGIRFAYHNHAFEFEKKDGEIPYDVLLKETDPDLVSFEMDLYWIKKGGYEPLDYFKKYPGRFTLWHVKDLDPETGKYTEVGSGNIDFKEIFENADTSGMEYFFVELDNSERPALESIKISFDYLNKTNFVR